jgi:hypothetical protein
MFSVVRYPKATKKGSENTYLQPSVLPMGALLGVKIDRIIRVYQAMNLLLYFKQDSSFYDTCEFCGERFIVCPFQEYSNFENRRYTMPFAFIMSNIPPYSVISFSLCVLIPISFPFLKVLLLMCFFPFSTGTTFNRCASWRSESSFDFSS